MVSKPIKLPAWTDDNVNLFISRFSTGRYSTQDNPDPITGRAGYGAPVKGHLNSTLVNKHLNAEITLASTAITTNNTCGFVVIDFDMNTFVAKDSIVEPTRQNKKKYQEELVKMQAKVTDTIYRLSEELKINRDQILIEKSGHKGYHLWMFFAEEVPARDAYMMTRVIAQELDLANLEIFPKQISGDDQKPGALIKIPLGVNKKNMERCLFLDDKFENYLDQWDVLAKVVPIGANQLNNLLKLKETEAARVEDDNIEDITMVGGSMESMISKCAVLTEFQERTRGADKDSGNTNFTHPERVAMLTLLKRFGTAGVAKIHEWLSVTDNYDPGECDKYIGNSNLKPITCERLRDEGICLKECDAIVLARGRSPIKLAMMGSRRSRDDIYVLNSLAEIENPILCAKTVRVDFTVSALVDAPYYSTRKVTYAPCSSNTCPEFVEGGEGDKKRDKPSKCTCENAGALKTVLMDNQSKEHIQFYGADDKTVNMLIRSKVLGCGAPNKLIPHGDPEKVIVQPFAAANVVRMLGQEEEQIDPLEFAKEERKERIERSAAKENKDYTTFFMGNSLETSKSYRGYGTVLPNPKDQSITLLFNKVEPLNGQTDGFTINEQNRGLFDAFRGMTVAEKIKDLRESVTFIHGRDELILAALLVHFSVLEFNFNNAPLSRGWVELMIIGDSGQAKSTMIERIVNYAGLGRIEYSNVSIAGLIGGVNKLQNKQFLQWGVLPRCNKGLIFLDEIQNLPPELWAQLRTVRTFGIAKVSKIEHGEHETRVRMICAANAKPFDKNLADFKYGATSLSSVLNPADIRRFDFACFLSEKDLDKDYANQLNEAKTPTISREMLRTAILWAWSRKSGDIVFSPDVTKRILEVSKILSDKYGGSNNVPLCNASDMREKIARLTVAYAALNLRSSDYIKLEPIVSDVDFILHYLDTIYSHPNVALDMDSHDKRRASEVDDGEYKELAGYLADAAYSKMEKAIEGLTSMAEVRAGDLAGWAGASHEEMAKIMAMLNKYQLLELRKYGTYSATPKLIRLYKRLKKEKDDVSKIF